jgi:hypothetical protein
MLGAIVSNRGGVLRRQDRLAEARACYEEAARHGEAAVAASPGQASYRQFLCIHYDCLAGTLEGLGQAAAAETTYQQLLAHAAQLTAAFPAVKEFRPLRASYVEAYAQFLSRLGRKAEAEKIQAEVGPLREQPMQK